MLDIQLLILPLIVKAKKSLVGSYKDIHKRLSNTYFYFGKKCWERKLGRKLHHLSPLIYLSHSVSYYNLSHSASYIYGDITKRQNIWPHNVLLSLKKETSWQKISSLYTLSLSHRRPQLLLGSFIIYIKCLLKYLTSLEYATIYILLVNISEWDERSLIPETKYNTLINTTLIYDE